MTRIWSSRKSTAPSASANTGMFFGHRAVRQELRRRRRFIGRCQSYQWRSKLQERWEYSLRESLKAWKRFARHAKGILAVAQDYDRGWWTAAVEDMSWFVDGPGWKETPLIPLSPISALDTALDDWLRQSEVRPHIVWHKAGLIPQLELGSRTVAGAIGLQLCQAVLRTNSWALCSDCGAFYPTKRKPRPGQNHYCESESCKTTAKNKNAQRKRRENLQKTQQRIEK